LVPFLLCLARAYPAHAQDPYALIGALPLAATHVDFRAGELAIELPAVEVPAGGTVLTPVYRVVVPFDVSLYGFAVELLDEAGAPAPRSRLHHIILTDPGRRDLFAPLAMPVFGASKESPSPILPKYLVGVPLPKGSHYIAAAMLVNPEARSHRFTVRLAFHRGASRRCSAYL
jgi:hypothetical protein